jgi:hypothetical protein
MMTDAVADLLSSENVLRLSLLCLIVPIAVVVVALMVITPLQAYRRGHGFLSWFVLQTLSFNPIYPLILVAILPNKARARQREEFARELDEKLMEVGQSVAQRPKPAGVPIDRSIGDAQTAASVGELPTADPRFRSIGEQETRP